MPSFDWTDSRFSSMFPHRNTHFIEFDIGNWNRFNFLLCTFLRFSFYSFFWCRSACVFGRFDLNIQLKCIQFLIVSLHWYEDKSRQYTAAESMDCVDALTKVEAIWYNSRREKKNWKRYRNRTNERMLKSKSTTATISRRNGLNWKKNERKREKKCRMRTILLLQKGNVRNGFKCPNISDKQ